MAKKLAFDQILFTTVVALVGLGLAMVYSASAVVAETVGGSSALYLAKQVVAALLGLAAMVAVMHVDYRRLASKPVIWALVVAVLALLALTMRSAELNSARRWLFFAGLSFQPSELAKPVLVAYLAYQIARRGERQRERELLLPTLLVAGLMAGLVLYGKDLGGALLLGSITGIMLFLAGLPWLHMAAALLLSAPLAAAAIWLVPYRRQRLAAFLDPERFADHWGFQPLQSLIAVGSGGLFGLGLGEGVQKLYFLPYPHSDFVFAIIGEELGLTGALGVVTLFGVLTWRGIRAGFRAPDDFGRYLAWGLTAALTVQAFLHISVALSLLPATGLTLPFISYGGSSLVVTMAASGVLLNISQHG